MINIINSVRCDSATGCTVFIIMILDFVYALIYNLFEVSKT